MGLRSVVYWSFVRCDDPKGVAEYKTIRQSKKMTQNWNSYEEEGRSSEEVSICFDKQESRSRAKQDSMESQRRDCYDELRQVIRESFARNNLFHPKDKPTLCTDSTQNPNIIAKLMGLEQLPSKSFKQTEKLSFPRRRLFDINLPAPSKPRFRGVIDGKYASVANFITKTTAVEEGPPIVIMRPRNPHELNSSTMPPKMVCAAQVPDQKKLNRDHEVYTVNSRSMPPKMNCAVEVPKQKKLNRDTVKIPTKKTADRVSSTMKPLLPTTKKKEATVEHTRKAGAAPNTRKQTAIKDVKPEDAAKRSTVKHSKGVRETNASKRQVDEGIKRMTSLKCNNIQKKNVRKGKYSSKPSAASVEDVRSDAKLIENTAPEQMRSEQVMDSSCVSVSEKSAISVEQSTEDRRCIFRDNSDETVRNQLMSSASFLNYAKELFDTAVLPTEHHIPEAEVDSVIIDCAKEMLKRNSLCCTRMRRNVGGWELVEEICEGIEYLRKYSGDSRMAERDLRRNEVVTGGWDLGWRKGYTAEDVNEVVGDIEKLVLGEVVASVVVEFLLR